MTRTGFFKSTPGSGSIAKRRSCRFAISSLSSSARSDAGGGVDEIDHVVADLAPLFGAWFVGCDVQSYVDLSGISDYDLAVEHARQLESQLGLADPGRSDDDRNRTQ